MDSKILLGDSLFILKSLKDSSVDHIITDPPYNISGKSKQTMVGPRIVTAEFGEWDVRTKEEYDELFDFLLKEMFRVCKPGANALIWLDRAYTGVAWFKAEALGWSPRNIIAAVKKNPSLRMRTKNLKSAWESCLWLSKGPVKTLKWNKEKKLDRNFFFYNIGAEKVSDHPNEKYESMIEPLVEMYSNEGDLILDPFCGSGTTAVVCKKKQRRFLVIDKDEKWINITKQRVETTATLLF